MMHKNFWTAVAAIAVLAFAAVVWPGRYRYDHLKQGSETFPVRIDRLTGKAEYFDGAWRSDGPHPAPVAAARTPQRYSPDNPFATPAQRSDTGARRP